MQMAGSVCQCIRFISVHYKLLFESINYLIGKAPWMKKHTRTSHTRETKNKQTTNQWIRTNAFNRCTILFVTKCDAWLTQTESTQSLRYTRFQWHFTVFTVHYYCVLLLSSFEIGAIDKRKINERTNAFCSSVTRITSYANDEQHR